MRLEDDHPYRHPWLGVEVRHLATLAALARTGSFRQAAADLGYVPSVVSQQVSALERVVGTALVERRRGRRAVALTPAGRLLHDRSVRIVAQLHAARVEIAAGEAGGGTTVRVAVAAGAAPLLAHLLPPVMRELPGVRLRIAETADDGELVARLVRGGADVAIGSPPADPAFATAPLLHDPFVLLTRADSTLARLPGIDAKHLHGQRLLVAGPDLSETHLRAAGVRTGGAVQVPIPAAIPPLVAAGAGVGLMPRSEAEEASDGLVSLPTTGLIAPRRVVLCWHAGRTRPAVLRRFCDAVTGAVAGAAGPAAVASLARAA